MTEFYSINHGLPIMSKVKPIPDGVSVLMPMLVCRDAAAEIGFCKTALGAVELVQDQFWGDRTGRIIDPSGHVWTIATRVEETSPEGRQERWSDIQKSGSQTPSN